MSRKLRFMPSEGSGLVEVTTRTVHGRFLLAPSAELNDLILGALGRAQELYPVRFITFAFCSGHYHLLLQVDDTRQLASFMNHFNSNLAREAGRLADWREKFWSRRFQAIPISDEPQAQIERLAYILSHGVKEGLVERLRDWPGVSIVPALLDGVRSPHAGAPELPVPYEESQVPRGPAPVPGSPDVARYLGVLMERGVVVYVARAERS